MEQLRAALSVIAAYLGRRLFAWSAAVAASTGIVLPWGEAQVVAFVLSGLSLACDLGVYVWRRRSAPKAMPAQTRNRALLVGINAYPGAPLRGCVNDVRDTAAWLATQGFAKSEILSLTDRQATAANIRAALAWVAGDYRPGDRRYFAYSGHGTQMPGSTEGDGKYEVICPIDYDWTEARAIRDVDFAAAFGQLPKGAIFDWVSDSCHSGGLADVTKGLVPTVRARSYPMSLDVARQLALTKGDAKSMHVDLNVGFVSGCRSDQTSADAEIDGRPCGAFTHYWLRRLKSDPAMPMARVAAVLRKDLAAGGFDQRPVVDGARAKRAVLR